jgi:hypothetical protein
MSRSCRIDAWIASASRAQRPIKFPLSDIVCVLYDEGGDAVRGKDLRNLAQSRHCERQMLKQGPRYR